MPVDGFTIGAQVVNFLVLVWLLKRFLYKPILDAIDAREQAIARALAEADAIKAEAAEQKALFENKNDDFETHRAERLAAVAAEADRERRRLLDEARHAADALAASQREAFRREQQGLDDELARGIRQELFATARKALADLSGTALEAGIVDRFTRGLRELGRPEREAFAGPSATIPGPVLVRSAFELSPAQRDALEAALADTFAAAGGIRFETASDLIGGIELTAGGRKIAWSLADYLAELEEAVGERLNARAGANAAPGAAARPDP